MFDLGFWDALEGAGSFAGGSGVDAWSTWSESMTWLITHSTSATASSNSAHSFSDRMEHAHNAVDMTTMNNPFRPRTPVLTQLVVPSLSLGSGHPLAWCQAGWHEVYHSIHSSRYDEVLEMKGICFDTKGRVFIHLDTSLGRESAERREED